MPKTAAAAWLCGSRPTTPASHRRQLVCCVWSFVTGGAAAPGCDMAANDSAQSRSEEHTSELQSQSNLVCRLLLEKKKKQYYVNLGAEDSRVNIIKRGEQFVGMCGCIYNIF